MPESLPHLAEHQAGRVPSGSRSNLRNLTGSAMPGTVQDVRDLEHRLSMSCAASGQIAVNWGQFVSGMCSARVYSELRKNETIMRSIMFTYPGFRDLPAGVKKMLLRSENLFFEETRLPFEEQAEQPPRRRIAYDGWQQILSLRNVHRIRLGMNG